MSYYFSNDDTVKSEIKKHDVIINNAKFSFYTDNGVFSKKGLDFGTRALLESLKRVDTMEKKIFEEKEKDTIKNIKVKSGSQKAKDKEKVIEQMRQKMQEEEEKGRSRE